MAAWRHLETGESCRGPARICCYQRPPRSKVSIFSDDLTELLRPANSQPAAAAQVSGCGPKRGFGCMTSSALDAPLEPAIGLLHQHSGGRLVVISFAGVHVVQEVAPKDWGELSCSSTCWCCWRSQEQSQRLLHPPTAADHHLACYWPGLVGISGNLALASKTSSHSLVTQLHVVSDCLIL